MGMCLSRPDSCVRGQRSSNAGARRRRPRSAKHRAASVTRKTMETIDEAQGFDGNDSMSYSNPAFQVMTSAVMTSAGSVEESWFDTFSTIESDEDDFKSVQDDVLHGTGSEAEGLVCPKSFRDDNLGVADQNPLSIVSTERQKGKKLVDQSSINSVTTAKSFVSHGDVSLISAEENAEGEDEGILNNCGILHNNCLPCLVVATATIEKRKSLSSSPPNSAKKASLKLSFKRKSGEATSTRFSSKVFLEKPPAGSQVQLCTLEKKILDSWSPIEPNTFRVRGEHYLKDKKKDFAPNCAAYSPFGVDVYLCQRKINHIAQFVQLPFVNSHSRLPSLLIVNVQVPLYPATLFQSETDGEGISFVLYFRLSEGYSSELPSHFLESIRRLMDGESEKCRGFPMDSLVPFRERLKILGRVANVEDLPLSTAERKIMHAYNEKPVLSRPQHEFYLANNYFEIDLDMHRFSYFARKGFETFIDRLKHCVLDIGLTIQGNKPEDLPEHVLCCVRLNGIDYSNYVQLAVR